MTHQRLWNILCRRLEEEGLGGVCVCVGGGGEGGGGVVEELV